MGLPRPPALNFFEIGLFPRFPKNLQKKILYSFQYSERTIASTETNNTPEQSSDIQFFAAGKFKGVALSGGHHTPLPQKHILLNFMAARRVFDFLPSMRSLGHHF